MHVHVNTLNRLEAVFGNETRVGGVVWVKPTKQGVWPGLGNWHGLTLILTLQVARGRSSRGSEGAGETQWSREGALRSRTSTAEEAGCGGRGQD